MELADCPDRSMTGNQQVVIRLAKYLERLQDIKLPVPVGQASYSEETAVTVRSRIRPVSDVNR